MFISKVMIYFFGAKQAGWNTCDHRRPEKAIYKSIWVERIKFNRTINYEKADNKSNKKATILESVTERLTFVRFSHFIHREFKKVVNAKK